MRHQFPSQLPVNYYSGSPRQALAGWSGGGLLVVDFTLDCFWLEQGSVQALTAVYARDEAGELHVGVTEQALSDERGDTPVAVLRAWGARGGFVVYQSGRTIGLQPLSIAKPWGQEIWYTGVEERGVCCFTGSDGAATPIPWLQAALPSGELGAASEPLVLLKILDPAAAAVTGDLYFELHREKREVYVVTSVDRQAWPDGVGAIKYGFKPEVISQYATEQDFRRAYLAAVLAYEQVRRQIDADPDSSEALREREAALRAEMEEFIQMRPLRVGDVVKVPTGLPHSLQHGVRTVEFQTPVYERLILSFAQEVITQGHWDTAEAVEEMLLLPPEEESGAMLPAASGLRRQRIVDFADFEVQRLDVRSELVALEPSDGYRLLMAIEGELELDGGVLTPEQAVLLPANRSFSMRATAVAAEVALLLAVPR